MTHVVAEPCFACKYTDCVVVCPVECFYEGASMGTFGLSSSYRDFTRVVVYLKTAYDGLNGQLNIDDIRIANTSVGG